MLLLALTVGPAAAATERERVECLGTLRRDYGECVRRTRAECQRTLDVRLGDCLGGPECPGACLATLEACQQEPLLARDGCRLACQADARVVQRGCRVEVDREGCRRAARVKAVKCKERCNRRATPPLHVCRDAFSECLRACAKEGADP